MHRKSNYWRSNGEKEIKDHTNFKWTLYMQTVIKNIFCYQQEFYHSKLEKKLKYRAIRTQGCIFYNVGQQWGRNENVKMDL